MNQTAQHFVFTRSEDQAPEALLRLNVTSIHPNSTALLEALKEAVTRWIPSCEAGRKLWAYAGEDLNIGDLVSHEVLSDPSFLSFAKELGITFFEVYEDQAENVPYDLRLVNAEALERED